MSRKGNCLDDAVIEGFLGTLKAEYFYLATIEDVEALQAGVNDYIDYDNSERVKLGLKEFSPVKYRLTSGGLFKHVAIHPGKDCA